MITKMTRLILPLLVLPLFVVACDDDPISSGTSEVSLLLTDNPGDVDSVWVEIDEIYLQGSGEQGRVTLLNQADADALGLIELTRLASRTLELVSDVEVPAGSYGQLRFVVEGAVLETEEDEVFTFNAEHPHGATSTGTLNCPSCTQTGIKVLLRGQASDLETGTHVIVLDFDVSQSFGREAGMSDMWVMKPVIQASEIGFTGAVSGTVALDDGVTIPECPTGTTRDVTSFIPEATAQALTNDDGSAVTVTSSVESDGSFAFPFLEPDDYDMGFVVDVAFNGDTLTFGADAPGVVTVSSGAEVSVGYTITSATCTESSSGG